MPRTMELRFAKEKNHGELPKTKKIWFIILKNRKNDGNILKTIEVFEQIYNFRTLIY